MCNIVNQALNMMEGRSVAVGNIHYSPCLFPPALSPHLPLYTSLSPYQHPPTTITLPLPPSPSLSNLNKLYWLDQIHFSIAKAIRELLWAGVGVGH